MLLLAGFSSTFSGAAFALSKDIVLVLDNSGSMKKNDPHFLSTKAVTTFVDGLSDDTRLAMIIFDKDVDLAVPLTSVTHDSREKILKGLEKINFRGLLTNSPAAIEQAIYELKVNGRADARKSIVFMTDGLVDTGDAAKDAEKSLWLREDLTKAAADADIRIFGIAFTNNADYQLIQTLSSRTGGAYYRALDATDIDPVFLRIKAHLDVEPETVEAPPAAEMPPPTPVATSIAPSEPLPPVATSIAPSAAPPPVVTSIAASPPPAPDAVPWAGIIIAAIVLGAIGVIVIVAARRKTAGKSAAGDVCRDTGAPQDIPEAYLIDLGRVTEQEKYPLTKPVTMVGKLAGGGGQGVDTIVIKKKTVSRQHAFIEYSDHAFWVKDNGSLNGTCVNGVKLTERVRLKHDDKITFDTYDFEFSMPMLQDADSTVFSEYVAPSASAIPVSTPVSIPASTPVSTPACTPESIPVSTAAQEKDETDMLDETACPNHPSWNASVQCQKCGHSFCNKCITVSEGLIVCTDCA